MLRLHLHLGSLHSECSAGSTLGAQCLSSFPEVPWLPCLSGGGGSWAAPWALRPLTARPGCTSFQPWHLSPDMPRLFHVFPCGLSPIPPPRMQGPFPFYLHQNCGHLSTQCGAWLWARRTGSPCFLDKDGTTWHANGNQAGPSGPSCNRLPRPPPHAPPAPRS